MSYEGQCEYVHVSGTAFVFIDGLANKNREPRKQPRSPFPQLHLSNYNQNYHGNQNGTGKAAASPDTSTQKGVYFLWVYNYLLTKRWRTSAAGDEKLHDKLLTDFINFCNDEDGRLSAYWEDVKDSAEVKIDTENAAEVDVNVNGEDGDDKQRS